MKGELVKVEVGGWNYGKSMVYLQRLGLQGMDEWIIRTQTALSLI